VDLLLADDATHLRLGGYVCGGELEPRALTERSVGGWSGTS
jgi:hypothetical protein